MLDNLNTEQKEAVLSDADLLITQAGAGTGKTKMLTTRIAKLIQDGVKPEKIMATTFTRKAAHEMKERAILLGGEKVNNTFIGTMHSFCFKLIRQYVHMLDIGHDFNLAFNDEQKILMEKAIEEYSDYPEGMDSTELRDLKKQNNRFFSDVISRWKENGLTNADVNERLKSEESEIFVSMCNIYLRYNELLRERYLLDPSDLTIYAVHLLSDDSIRESAIGHLEYLMVDEFQDTNLGQMKLIRLLCSEGAKLTVVGDDDQSLYSFRGSIPSLMKNVDSILKDIFQNKKIQHVKLIKNYRCTDNILMPANMLVDYNSNHSDDPKILESGRSGESVTVSVYGTAKQEATAIAKLIKEMNKKKVPYSEIAVLSRQNRCLTTLEVELQSKNIPYTLNSGTSFFDRSEVCDILAYFQLALNPELDIALQRIIARPTRNVGASTAEVIATRMMKEDLPAYEIILDMIDNKQLRGAKAQEGAGKLAKDLQYIHEIYMNGGSPYDIISYILIDMEYKQWVMSNEKDDNRNRKNEHIGLILSIAKNSETIEEFLENTGLSGYNENEEDKVFIGSIHGSKGLEWDNVFIMAFEKNIIPSSDSISNEDDWDESPWNLDDYSGLEEERRLAHVALTRARNIAKISFAMNRPGGPENKKPGPSPFIKDADLKTPDMSSVKRNMDARNYWRNKKGYGNQWG